MPSEYFIMRGGVVSQRGENIPEHSPRGTSIPSGNRTQFLHTDQEDSVRGDFQIPLFRIGVMHREEELDFASQRLVKGVYAEVGISAEIAR